MLADVRRVVSATQDLIDSLVSAINHIDVSTNITSVASAGVAAQVGTTTVGDPSTPVYISSGVPTACTTTGAGPTTYVQSITISSYTGYNNDPLVDITYVDQNGTSSSIGGIVTAETFYHNTPEYTVAGANEASMATVASALGSGGYVSPSLLSEGDSATPVYFSNGVPSACNVSSMSVGSAAFASSASHADTAYSATSADNAVFAESATVADSAYALVEQHYGDPYTVGDDNNPVYFSDGMPAVCGTSLAVSCTSANSAGSAVSAASCTGNAATATSAVSAGYADTAGRVGTTIVGSTTRPVYISSGIPVSCGTSLAVSCTSANSAGSAVSAGTATSAVNAGSAASAGQIGTATVGSVSSPVYISSGTPQAATVLHMTTRYAAQTSGTAVTINVNLTITPVFYFKIGTDTTFNFTGLPTDGQAITVTFILENAASYTVTWPSDVIWAGGRTPLLTTGVDVVHFTIIA